jgi:hypothetical protein
MSKQKVQMYYPQIYNQMQEKWPHERRVNKLTELFHY